MNDDLNHDAELRHRLHQRQRSHRPLSKGYERVGLAGEAAFCDMMGIPLDRSLRPQGTNGINYTINGKTVNVYAARKAWHLLVEATPRATRADVYVLSQYDERTGTAELIGWATRDEVVSRPPTADIGKRGVKSHAIHRDALRPMVELYGHMYDLRSEPDLIGLAGELAFVTRVLGTRTFIPQRDRRRPIPVPPWTVRVVTDRNPSALLWPVDEPLSRIVVLAGIESGSHPDNVYWVGWYPQDYIEAAPVREGTDYREVAVADLKPMADLYQFIGAKGPDAIAAEADRYKRDADPSIVQDRLFG